MWWMALMAEHEEGNAISEVARCNARLASHDRWEWYGNREKMAYENSPGL
jgi:hypothetical protein